MSAHEKTATAHRIKGTRGSRSNTADSTDAAGLFPRPVTDTDRDRAARAAERVMWMVDAQIAAWNLIADGHPFDAHAITEAVGTPFPGDGRNLATIIRNHRRHGHIERAAFRLTRRPTSGAAVAVWRPTDQGRRMAEIVLHGRGRAA